MAVLSYQEQKAALDVLYAELPSIDCQGKCLESCGPIVMSRIEWKRILRHPVLKGKKEPRMRPDFSCPFLVSERCGVYKIRPMICRLWGVVESMPCHWGCVPDRTLTHAEGYEFLIRADIVSARTEEDATELQAALAYLQANPDSLERHEMLSPENLEAERLRVTLEGA